jgi:galactokinase
VAGGLDFPVMDSSIADLKGKFASIFGGGGKIHVVRAPGRVNLIGEHTDYNDGFVFPMAIEPQLLIVCRGRSDSLVRVASTAFEGEIAEFNVDEKIERGQPKWANYNKGVAAELIAAGITVPGMDALMANTLPVGGGLSSSAAILVGSAVAFLTIAGLTVSLDRLALIAQRAEHEYALMPSGIMDQTIVASGKVNHAMLLDCRDNAKSFVPIDSKELRVAIVNTMIRHELSTGEYAQRRKQCETAVAYFKKENPGIKALRDVKVEQVEAAKKDLGDLIYRRAKHVVTEIARTTQAAALLNKRRYEEFGDLMAASHASLRDDYEVSCKELDFLAEEAPKVKGVYGARMTGGGFGGCIVALTQPRAVAALSEHLKRVYQDQFKLDPAIYVTTATAGASVLE